MTNGSVTGANIDRDCSRSGNSIRMELAEGGESLIEITGIAGMDRNGLKLLARMTEAGFRVTIPPPHHAGYKRRVSAAFHNVRLCALTMLIAIPCAVLYVLVKDGGTTTRREAASESQKLAGSANTRAITLNSPVERTHGFVDRARRSVCLIQGTLRFRNGETGELLTRSEWTLGGGNELVEISFSGTGFLVSAEGKILTNRHIAEPWWENGEAQQIIAKGYRPDLQRLVAYFPALPARCVLKTLRTSRTADLALLQSSPVHNLPAPLSLDTEESIVPGTEILLLGYPGGLSPIIARSPRARLERIPGYLNFTEQQVSQVLAKRNLIEPLLSGGYVSNVSSDILTLSALTSDGSSGSPVFNDRGRVSAIVFASLTEVAGGTLAAPARLALELTGAP